MKHATRWAGALALGTLLAVAGPALARPGFEDGPHGSGRAGRHGALLRQLDLTEDQKASLRDLAKQQRESALPLRERERTARRELRAALEQTNPDPAQVGRLALGVHQVRRQQQARREQFKQQFLGLLTPEQRSRVDQLESLRHQRQELLRQWHAGGPGAGPDAEHPGR